MGYECGAALTSVTLECNKTSGHVSQGYPPRRVIVRSCR
jgi:hypothetical protein